MSQRIGVLALLLGLAFLGLAARLAYVQVERGEDLQLEASRNAARGVSLPAPRGLIVDSHNRLLVRNRPRFLLTFVPAQVRQVGKLLDQLAELFGMSEKSRQRLHAQAHQQPLEPIVLKYQLDDFRLARVAELQGQHTGLSLEAQPVREYPFKTLACHILGHIGEVDPDTLKQGEHQVGDWVGKDGLELRWQKQLEGHPGTRVMQVDAAGRQVRVLRESPPEPGNDLHLTLDLYLQQQAEKALSERMQELEKRNNEPSAGVVVAMEADSGKIRALVSLPGYEPGWFSQGASPRQFQALLSDERAPLLNRAISSSYPPGSTFKLVTSTAALAEGLVPPGASYYCSGQFMVGDLPFHCFVRSGHGSIGFENSLSQSCDVVFYQLGVKLGVSKLHSYAETFGIGSPTGVDLPGESEGILPDAAYKQRLTHEGWFAGDEANMAIGQGFLAVSPLQMAVVTAAMANGGKVLQPYLVEKVTSPSGAVVQEIKPRVRARLPLAPEQIERIRVGMRGAVAYGTATRAYDPGLVLAGKTGTVENLATPDNPRGRNHTWFVCYGPERPGPKLVVVVFLEKSGGYGGAVAAPVAHDVVAAWEGERFVGPMPGPVRRTRRRG